MVWVNLLPWRQAELHRRWRIWRFTGGVSLLVIALLMLKGVSQHHLNQQQERVQGLWRTALNDARALNERVQLAQQQLRVLQSQQTHLTRRHQQMALWHDFAHQLGAHFPASVWLNTLHKTRQGLALRGVGNTILDLHQLRDRLHDVALFDQVTLGPVQRSGKGEITFVMQAVLALSARGEE